MKILAILLCAAALALAAAPEGKWVADTPGMSGALEKTNFDLHVAGDKVTGTVSSGNNFPIEGGTLMGDEVKFFITVQMGHPTKLTYVGKIAGDEMKMTRAMEGVGRKAEFVAKPGK